MNSERQIAYEEAVIKIAGMLPELIDEIKRLRAAIDRMPRGRY